MGISLNYSNALIREKELEEIKGLTELAHQVLLTKSGAGSDFLGWADLPTNYNKEEFSRILKASKKIKDTSEALLVIGIGGSYLGAKSAISALTNNFHNEVCKEDGLKIYFAGQNMSESYLIDLYNLLKDKDFSINVISKSGTTTEPAIAFRIFKELLEEKYKDKAKEKIFVTTDAKKGALKELSNKEGYETFVVPDDVGGRFSVLTAVGLLPIACAGIDIEELMAGARVAEEKYSNKVFEENDALIYAALRNILYNKGKTVEIMANYTPELVYISEWWKQLYGESEGKDQKGILPASVTFTTDLHSMGQMIQDGRRNIFETVLLVNKVKEDIFIKEDVENLDGLNYLVGKGLSEVNRKAFEGTMAAHVEGGVPNIIVEIEKLDAFNIGSLFYFFEKACAVSGYLLGVNPFNQPGVEKYKTNMFKLLGKPGYWFFTLMKLLQKLSKLLSQKRGEKMFEKGEIVFYKNIGVCKVDGITKLDFALDPKQKYYVMKSIYKNGINYVPIDGVADNIRNIISKEEAEELIDKIKDIDIEVKAIIDMPIKEMTELYEEKINSGNPEDILKLVLSIDKKKGILLEEKKKFGAIDDSFLKKGTDMFCEEVAAALGIKKESMPKYIKDRTGFSFSI